MPSRSDVSSSTETTITWNSPPPPYARQPAFTEVSLPPEVDPHNMDGVKTKAQTQSNDHSAWAVYQVYRSRLSQVRRQNATSPTSGDAMSVLRAHPHLPPTRLRRSRTILDEEDDDLAPLITQIAAGNPASHSFSNYPGMNASTVPRPPNLISVIRHQQQQQQQQTPSTSSTSINRSVNQLMRRLDGQTLIDQIPCYKCQGTGLIQGKQRFSVAKWKSQSKSWSFCACKEKSSSANGSTGSSPPDS